MNQNSRPVPFRYDTFDVGHLAHVFVNAFHTIGFLPINDDQTACLDGLRHHLPRQNLGSGQHDQGRRSPLPYTDQSKRGPIVVIGKERRLNRNVGQPGQIITRWWAQHMHAPREDQTLLKGGGKTGIFHDKRAARPYSFSIVHCSGCSLRAA